MTDWFTSDTHFGDKNTLKHFRRPFSSVEEMDNSLIQNWNSVVKKDDVVNHLGDFGNFSRVKELNGKILLVLGNKEQNYANINYKGSLPKLAEYLINLGFEDIYLHKNYSCIDGLGKVNLVHKPEDCNINMFNLFGHIYNLQMVKRFGLNVGVDCHNLFPITTETVKFYKNAIENIYDNNVFIG